MARLLYGEGYVTVRGCDYATVGALRLGYCRGLQLTTANFIHSL